MYSKPGPSVEIPNRLSEFRALKFWTQAELAQKAGVSLPTITRIEGGRWVPQSRIVRKLAQALGVRPENIFEDPVLLQSLRSRRRITAVDRDSEA